MLKHLPNLCVGEAEFVKLIVSVIESRQLNALVTQLVLEELTLFGEGDYDDVLSKFSTSCFFSTDLDVLWVSVSCLLLAGATISWDSFEQIAFWQLLNAELGGRPERIERLFLTAGTVTGLEVDGT